MADQSTDVFLRIIAEKREAGLIEIRDELIGLRDDLRQTVSTAKKTAVGLGTIYAAGKLLSRMLRAKLAPSITTVLGRLKDLAKNALSAVNPITRLGGALQKFFRTLKSITTRYLIYRTLGAISDAVRGITATLMETAPAFEEVRMGFYNLASAAGTTGDKIMRGMQKASKGTLTQLDLMKKTNYAIEVYGRQIIEYLPELVAGARRASKALGVDLTYAYESLINGISRMRKNILDNIGVVFDAKAAYKAYAIAHNTTADALTETEKKAAYLAATLKFLRAQEAALGEDTYTARDAMAALKVSIKDLAVTSLQAFMPVLKRIFVGLNTVVQYLGPPFRTAVEGAAIVLDTFVTIVKNLARAITTTSTFKILKEWAVGIYQTIGYFVNQLDEALPRIIHNLRQMDERISGGTKSFQRLRDAVATTLAMLQYGFKAVLKAMAGDWDGFWHDIGEGAKTGLTFVLMAVMDWGRTIFSKFDEWTGGFFSWGVKLVFEFANGFIKGATTALVQALTFMGGVIQAFLGAFSPPKKGPLRDIVQWGLKLIESYFHGFSLASFDLFERAIRPIEQRLQSLLSWGDIDEGQFADVLSRARELLAEYGLQLQETGIINEDVLGQLSELMQGAGDDVIQYIRVLSRLVQAQTAMEAVQEEYNKEAEKGFVSEQMATKMREARLALKGAEEEEEWERAFVTQRQIGIDIWIHFEDAAKKAADAVGGLIDDLNLGIADLGMNLGATIDEFREKFRGLFKDLPALGFSEAFEKMQADVNWFMRGLAGEEFPRGLPEGPPAAFVRGEEMRKAFDKLRQTGEELKETWGPLLEKFKEFMDEIDVEKLGEWVGWFFTMDSATQPLRKALAGLTEGFGKLLLAMVLLSMSGLLPLLLPLATAVGLIGLMAELTDTSFTDQLELIRKFWGEDWPESLETLWTHLKTVYPFLEEQEKRTVWFWGDQWPKAIATLKQKWDEFWAGAEKTMDQQEKDVQSLKERWNEFFGASEENFAQYEADFQGVTNVWEGILAVIRAAINAAREFFGLQASGGPIGMPGGTPPGGGDQPSPGDTLGDYPPPWTPPPWAPPPDPGKYQWFQHGGFIPETGLYGLHKKELVLNEGQWRSMWALRSPSLPADLAMGGAATQGPLIHMEHVYIREDEDIERLASRISHLIGQRADRRARLGA